MKRFNRLVQTNLPEAMMQLNRLDKSTIPTKRARLNLPAPTLSEKELDSLLYSLSFCIDFIEMEILV